MKIAIYSDTFLPQVNGVTNVVYRSAEALARRGHNVRIYTVTTLKPREWQKINGGRIELVNLPSVPFWGYAGERVDMSFGINLPNVKKFAPDIIHSHTPFSAGWEAVLAARYAKTCLVGTHHTFYDHYLKHIKMDYQPVKKFTWHYTARYYNLCDLVISPSRALAHDMTANGLKKKPVILPNPIDTGFFTPALPDAKARLKKRYAITGRSLVFLGRLSYEKSIDRVISIFAEISAKLPDIRLMIIGDGPEREKLEKQAKRLKVEKGVIFTGILRGQALLEALQANDVFITASESENQPLTMLEAQAVGLPLVAVAAGGLPEIVRDGTNGRLFRPGNDKRRRPASFRTAERRNSA